jgi:DinB superfamily
VRTLELLAEQMDQAFQRLRVRCRDLSDEEFFWEPVTNCWTVFRDPEAPGGWSYHYILPDPDPAPVTTIGWRLNHIALCKVMYHEYAFGQGQLTWETIETPGPARGTLALLDSAHALLEDDLRSQSDSDLQREVFTNWGELWPTWRIFHTMSDHDAQHGAEIGVLRDLFHALPRH